MTIAPFCRTRLQCVHVCPSACVRLDLSGSLLLHLCTDFKIIRHRCCPWRGKVSFETFLGRLEVKVTLAGHINELFRAITLTYMHGFQNNFVQVFSLRSSAIWKTQDPSSRLILIQIWILCQLGPVLVMIFLQIRIKNPNLKKIIFTGLNIMNRCFKWHFYSSRRTIVPNYSEIHA